MASSRLHVDILWYSDILWSDVLLAKHDYTHHWWAERCQRNSPDDPVELRTTLNGRWDILNDLGACGTSSCGKRTQMPPQRTVRSTTRTQDNQWNTLKQCELFCKKGACIVLFERRAVCCFMFGTGLVCKSMLMRVLSEGKISGKCGDECSRAKVSPGPSRAKGQTRHMRTASFPIVDLFRGSHRLQDLQACDWPDAHTHTHTYIYSLCIDQTEFDLYII